MKNKLLRAFMFLCAGFLGISGAQTSGTLNGTVTAVDGRPVPSASVTVSGPSGFSQNTVTRQNGQFSVKNVPAGTYHLEVRLTGYRTLSQDNVQVSTGNPVSLTLTMEQGNSAETVQVQGEPSQIQDENAQIGRAYTGRTLSELPIQDLSSLQLTELMPGVSPPMPFTAANPLNSYLVDPQQNRVWNTNGQPAQSNNIKLDGVENLQASRGTAVHVPTINSIQVMNLTTSNYEAEQGRATGSVLNQITRTGANGIHGSLFEYHSDDWLRARSFFDPSPFAQPRFTSNEFGGTLGGAIVPNRSFFFLSYEGDYLRDQVSTFSTVPTAQFLTGNFGGLPPAVTIYNPGTGLSNGSGRTAFTNNQIPSNLINPVALAIARALPQPNLPGIENNYFSNAPLVNDGNRVDARADHRFSGNTSMFMRYGLSYYNTLQASPLGALGAAGGSSRLRAHDAAAGVTHNFSPQTLTELRLSYTRSSDPINPSSSLNNAGAFGFTGGNGALPYIQIQGIGALGTNPNYPQINKQDTYNIANNWSMRLASSDLRLGWDLWSIRQDGFQALNYGPQGGYTFSPGATSLPGAPLGQFGSYANSFAAFLLGAPTLSGITTNSFVPSYISDQYSGWVSDRLHWSRLTIDLGLRYDYFQPVNPRNNASAYSIYNPATNTLSPLGSNSVDRYGNVASNNLNFAPRIGLAWRWNDRTVVRTAYGLTYWDPGLQFASSSLIPTTTTVENGVAGGLSVAPGTFGVLPTASGIVSSPLNRAVYYTNSTMRTPYIQFYNVDVQHDMGHGILGDVAYVGNVGRQLPYTSNVNAAAAGAGTAGLPFFSSFGRTADTFLRGTGETSNYNALQVNMTKRFADGIGVTVAYTWSKSLDYGAGLSPFLNNLNPRSNYGPSDFDRTHIFTVTHNWQLPFGTGTRYLNHGIVGQILGPWELDGIYRYATGLPFTPLASAATCACPGNTATANVVPGPTVSGINYYPSYLGYYYYAVPYLFSTFSFGQPAAGTFGNVGRNSVRGPNFTNYDLAISRHFVFYERARLEFRAEAYNLANSTHFGAPIANVNSANFGQSTGLAPGLGERTIQFAAKLVF